MHLTCFRFYTVSSNMAAVAVSPDPAFPLANQKHERFCQVCAGGANATQAYKSVGYSKLSSSSGATQLAKKPEVLARIRWLRDQSAQFQISQIDFTKQRVLHRLDTLSRKAEAKKQYACAAKCEELIGREVGMFRDQVDHSFKWNGDLSQLTESQKAQLSLSLESIAFKDNPEGHAAWKASEKVFTATAERVMEPGANNEEADIAADNREHLQIEGPGPDSDPVDFVGAEDSAGVSSGDVRAPFEIPEDDEVI